MSLLKTKFVSSSTGSRAVYICLFLIIITGFGFRYVMINGTVVDSPVRADAAEYFSYAFNMRFNHVYSKQWPFAVDTDGKAQIKEDVQPDALRNPGYPLFVMLFVGAKPLASILKEVYFAQAILSTLTILVVFLILRNMVPVTLALAGAFMVAISPHLISMNVYLLSEALFIFALSILLLSLINTIKTGLFKPAILSGFILGAALMVKPTLSYLIWFLLPYMFTVFHRKQAAVVCSGIVAGYLLIYFPWIMRNLLVLGAVSPSSLAVESIHNGMYLGFMYNNIPESYGHPYAYAPDFEGIQSMSVLLGVIYDRFLQHPMDYILWYCFEKPRIFLSWDIIQGMGDVFIYPVHKSPYDNFRLFMLTHDFMKSIHPVVNGLAVLGMTIIWLPSSLTGLSKEIKAAGGILSIVLIYFLLVHAVATPLPRYAIPVMPIMYCLSMLALFSTYRKLQLWRRSRKENSK